MYRYLKPIVWVEGIIAAGKSTLVGHLAEALGYRAFPEPVANQGYLELFYQDPKRWAFSMQIEMLRRRWEIHRLARLVSQCGEAPGCLLDRGLPGDRVFAWLHYQTGNMHRLEWETYERLYGEFIGTPQIQPSLMIYLDVEPEEALRRVRGRARSGEDEIPLYYLVNLATAYRFLLAEVESGSHPWSNSLKVVRIPWTTPNQDTRPIVMQVQAILEQLQEGVTS